VPVGRKLLEVCAAELRVVSFQWVRGVPVFLSLESSIHSWSSVYFFSNAIESD
jgi:hypothetical protein